jgi:NAD(P)-dependent dehydrogenase (short-subunit alcohol dehydrogenase family)
VEKDAGRKPYRGISLLPVRHPVYARSKIRPYVLFSSMLARTGTLNGADYAAATGGILGFARTLALEVAHENIRVNTVSPRITDTAQSVGSISAAQSAEIPLSQICRVDDMVEACLFLLSEESSYFTGQDIRLKGGAPLW